MAKFEFSTIITFVISKTLERQKMGERKTWTPEEDQILRQLYEDKNIKKWSVISQIMETTYHIEGRNGKQCRERYHNHLKGGISKERWTKQEEDLLVQLHSQHGNRWALISKLISGRTENCVKNMFNSKLRKSVRLLNRFIYLYYRKVLKQIKINFVNRLSEFTEAAHKKPEHLRNPEENAAIYLKNQILRQDNYEVHEMSQEQNIKVRTLIEQIHAFKKDSHKYYRGNVLARLRKQRLKRKASEATIKIQQQLTTNPKTAQSLNYKLLQSRQTFQTDNLQKQNNIVQQHNLAQLVKQQPQQINKPLQQPNSQLLQRKGSLCRLYSLQSNNNSILGNDRLEMPIQVDNYMHNVTPTHRYEGENLDYWSYLSLI